MTALEFNLALTGSQDTIKISGKDIFEPLTIVGKLESKGVIVKNCTFHEFVVFDSLDLNYGIQFVNCKFEKTLSINNCAASSYDHNFNFDGYHIILSNTTIQRGLFFNGDNFIDRGVMIEKESIINNLKVDKIITKSGSFTVHNSVIEHLFDVINCSFIGSLEVLGNSTIKSKVRFQNVSATSLNFVKSNFEKDVHIWAGKFSSLVFNDGVFNDTLYISAVSISNMLTIIGAEFKRSILFNIRDKEIIGSISKIYIASCKFGEHFILNGNNTIIDDLNLLLSTQLEGTLDISHCDILNTTLSGNNYNCNLNLIYCKFQKLTFQLLYNYSTISIMSAKAFDNNSEIAITDSYLGKTHFLNMFFNTFQKINVYNSVLTEIVTTNVKWFEPEKLNPSDTKETYEYTLRREVFRQLKYVLEKQGNRIESLKFKSLETKAFKQELFSRHKWYKRIFNNDRFILWIGWTNNFGLNWVRAVLLILGFVAIFYWLIVIGISDKLAFSPNLSIDSFKVTGEEFIKYLYAYPQLLNPVHSIDKVFPNVLDFGFWVHSIDYLIKIFLAFFIYQIISAFRKFTK